MIGDGPGKLESLIADISVFDRAECLDRWREIFGRPPPKHPSPQFMKRVLIWETQNEVLGALSLKTSQLLNQIASVKSLPAISKPESHLIREWNGRTYQVKQPEDLTTDCLIKTRFPAIWSEQREQFAAL